MVYYDYSTKNKSFINTSKHLTTSGYRYATKILKLVNKALVGVDPFGDLTPEQQEMVKKEIEVNPWYFVRECVLIKDVGSEAKPFNLRKPIFLLLDTMFTDRKTYTTTVRQAGKTTTFGVVAKRNSILGKNTAFLNTSINDANYFKKIVDTRIVVPSFLESEGELLCLSTYNRGTIDNKLDELLEMDHVLVDNVEFHRNPSEIVNKLFKAKKVNMASSWNSNLPKQQEEDLNEFFSACPEVTISNLANPYDRQKPYRISINIYSALTRTQANHLRKVLMVENNNHPDLQIRKPKN